MAKLSGSAGEEYSNMVLYSEQTRKLSSETNLLNDATDYAVPKSYALIKNYGSVTAPDDGLLCFRLRLYNTHGVYFADGNVSVWVDDQVIFVSPELSMGASSHSSWVQFFVPVDAGSHTLKVYGLGKNSAGVATVQLSDFICGFCTFSDFEYAAVQEYTGAVTVNCPSRNTPLGTLAYATLMVKVGAVTASAITELENNGESKTNGVKLKVNGSYVDWTSRVQGVAAMTECGGYYIAVVPVDTDYVVTFEKDNAATDVYVAVTICPWLLTGSNTSVSPFPVTADFPPNSTLYITLEPLIEDVTSFAAIGKPRCISFGDSTDYYTIAEATGINSLQYTFELVSPDNVGCYVGGFGACIAYIGVDVV